MTSAISSLATYVPSGRLAVAELRRHWPGVGGPGGVRAVAVAGFDEDVVTMAAEAAECALAAAGVAVADVDLLIVATCSSPYAEHSAAAEVARAVGLNPAATLTDLAGSTLGGVVGLTLADDAVRSGRCRHVLVVASECRRGRPGTAVEALGAGAAAVLVTADGPVEIDKAASWRHGVPTRWRPDGAAGLHHYDDARYEVSGQMAPAVEGAIARLGDVPRMFHALGPIDARGHATLSRSLKLEGARGAEEIVQVGDLGSAAPLFALANCLADSEVARGAGACVAVEPGSGAAAVGLVARGPVPMVARRSGPVSVDYVGYLQRTGVLVGSVPPEPIVPWAATPGAARDDAGGSLAGVRCEACGSLHVPPRGVCADCGGDRFTRGRAPRTGTVVTFNVQHVVAVHPEPAPVAVAVVRLAGEGGARGGQVSAMICDSDLDALAIGDAVELVYRRLGADDGLVKYGWKARVVAPEGQAPEVRP